MIKHSAFAAVLLVVLGFLWVQPARAYTLDDFRHELFSNPILVLEKIADAAVKQNKGQVLGDQTVSSQVPLLPTRSDLSSMVQEEIHKAVLSGLFKGPQGDKGEKGDPGSDGVSTSSFQEIPLITDIPANPSNNFQGARMLSATDFSSNNLTTNNLNAVNLNVSSSQTISGPLSVITASSPQVTFGYDSSDNWSSQTNSSGITTFSFSGSDPRAVFKPGLDSTSFLQVQDSSSNPVLTVDTSNHGVSIDGTLSTPSAPTATTNYGLVSIGSAPFDGATSGYFQGSSNGTQIAVNAASNFAGNLLDLQTAGSSKLSVSAAGNTFMSGLVAIGPTATPGSVTFNATYKPQLNLITSVGNDNTNAYLSLFSHLVLNNTTNNTVSRYGNYNLVEVPTTNTVNNYRIYGSYGKAMHNGTGTISRVWGTLGEAYNESTGTIGSAAGLIGSVYGDGAGTVTTGRAILAQMWNSGAGTITNGRGIDAGAYNSGAGTITSATAVGADITNASGSIGTAYGVSIGGPGEEWSNGTGTVTTSYGLYLASNIDIGTTRYAIYSASASNSYLAANLGIGTTSPGTKLAVAGTASAYNASVVSGNLSAAPGTGTCAGQNVSTTQAVFQSTATITSAHIFYNSTRGKHARITSVSTCTDGSSNQWRILTLTDSITGQAATDAFTVYNPAGDLGTSSAGFFNNAYVINGQFVTATTSGGFDIAEQYETDDNSIEAGDVVSLKSDESKVEKAYKAYSSTTLGIVSTNPGLTLGNETQGTWVKIALAGRVEVKVTTENGNIKIGDPLTASAEKPGYAMKATQPGYIIGYAMENYDGLGNENSKKVLAFISKTYYVPTAADYLQKQDNSQAQILTELDSLNMMDASAFGKLVVMSSAYIGGDLKVAGAVHTAELVADKITATEVNADRVCIKDLCINYDQLKQLLQTTQSTSASSSEPALAPDPTPTPTPTPAQPSVSVESPSS